MVFSLDFVIARYQFLRQNEGNRNSFMLRLFRRKMILAFFGIW
jgi:hypothetical protein